MEATLKVLRSGNSDVVVLPAAWRRKHGIHAGDKVHARETADGGILFTPEKMNGNAGFAERLSRLREENSRYSSLVSMTLEEMEEAAHER